MQPSAEFTTIVMPALNEEHYIAEAIRSVLPAEGLIAYELLVLDGGSTDRTRTIVSGLAAVNPHIKLVDNPRRTQSAAVNIASETCDSRTTVLVRADCHAIYPPRFVENCIAALRSTDGASVVVSMRAVGRTSIQKAIAAAQNSRLGNGGSRHRRAAASGYVVHGHHAAFDRYMFRKLGGYDESAPYNEDAEFDARLIAAGGRIYLDGQSTIEYYPRSSFFALARQYYRHGWGRANTLAKHAMQPKVRQVLPVGVLLMWVLCFAAWPFVGAIALLPPAAYLLACLAWGAVLAVNFGQPALFLSGLAAVTMHMSWAAGFLRRFLEVSLVNFPGTRNRRA